MAAANIIYGLVDSRTGEIRYVGKSTSGLRRPREHFTKRALAERTHKANWIRSVVADGGVCLMVVLQRCTTTEELSEAERWWIAMGRAALGARLTNSTDGGDGCSGREASPKLREHMRRLGVANRGRVLTSEHRAKVGAAGRGRVFSTTHRAGIAAANRQRPVLPETRAKMSAKALSRTATAAGRQHLASMCIKAVSVTRGVPKTPEHRAKLSVANRRRA